MTETAKKIIAAFEKELEELPEEEQEEYAAAFLEDLRRRKRAKEEGPAKPYASFRVLKEAKFSGRSDESTTYEHALYGVEGDDE